jgi:3-mercaptopropionate dioxygenase
MRGAERCDEYRLEHQTPLASGHCHVMQRGDIEAVSPTVGDWHRVSNAMPDTPSISIHVYGANIGAVARQRLDDAGQPLGFVSGYDSRQLPNLWDRSAAVREQAPC